MDNSKLFAFFISLIIICLAIFLFTKFSDTTYYHLGKLQLNNQALNTRQHRILIVCTNKNMGGAEIHALNLYKNLLKKSIPTHFLIAHNSLLKSNLIEQQLPFYTCDSFRISGKIFNRYFSFQPGLEQAIRKICKEHNISIIQCNQFRETAAARKAIDSSSVKIAYTHHVPDQISPTIMQAIDGIIGVSPSITEMLEQQKNTNHFTQQKVVCIHPFFDEEKFLTFIPTTSRGQFFQESFNAEIKKDIPLLCMISHYYADKRKNHELLLKGLQVLIYQKNKPIQVVFAGNGVRSACEKTVKEYKLENYTHFLGNTNQTPALLFYTDINILPSFKDAFPIAILEGTFMKKPTIVSSVIGPAHTLILHEQTGLIFENNNLESLVKNIERYLDNPEFAKQLGENAFIHAMKNYSNEVKLEKLLTFYKELNPGSSPG